MLELKTYSVSLFFSQTSHNYIKSIINKIAGITGNNYILNHEIPPHITVGMFKAFEDQEKKLINYIKDAGKNFKSFDISFYKYDSFKNKLLFLEPDMESAKKIILINKRLHDVFLPDFSPACNMLYIPDNYFPHLSVASGLTNIQLEKVASYLRENDFNHYVKIERISLACRNPYRVIYNLE